MKIRLDQNNIKWGVTAFLVILCSIFAFFIILRFSAVKAAFATIKGILSPFIWGFVIAYLLCPIYNGVVRKCYTFLHERSRSNKRALMISKVLGTIFSLAVLLTVVAAVSWMIVPGLYDSIVNIIEMLPSGTEAIMGWLDAHLARFPVLQSRVDQYVTNSTDILINFFTTNFLPHYSTVAAGISSGILGAVTIVKNILIGVIVSVYFLNSKDVFAAQLKKVIFALCSEKRAESILDLGHFTNNAFGGFISGKIIDSAIIGLICFACMTAFGWEYSLLISCIIGITNIIPFFGPFIGAIPSMLLLLMVHPMQALYFGIFVLLLQQFDGNILGPKILGDRTGIGSFWVLFAVIIGGGLLGVVGMIVAIPIFAVLYNYATQFVNERLSDKGFSTSLTDYKIDSYRSTATLPTERKGIMKILDKMSEKRKAKKNKEDNDIGNE